MFVRSIISSLLGQQDSLQVRRACPQGSNATGYQDDAVEPRDNVGHPEPPVVAGSQHSRAKRMKSIESTRVNFHLPAAAKLWVENVNREEERPEIGGEVPEK